MLSKVKRSFLLLSAFLVSACFSMPAEAHYFSIIARSANAPVGENYQIMLSFTHSFSEAQFNGEMFGLGAEIASGNLHFSDGTSAAFPAFSDHDDPNGTEIEFLKNLAPDHPLYDADLAALYALMTGNDSFVSSHALDKEGTVIADGIVVDMPMMGATYNAYSKLILNAQSDGFSMTKTAPAGMVEIVPLSDLGEAYVGEEITFQVLFDGVPVADAVLEWADEATETTIGPEGNEKLNELDSVSDKDGIFAFTPENAGLQFLGVMIATPDGYASSTLIFSTAADGASAPYSSDSSGSCNTASFGGILMLACIAALPFAKYAMKRKNS